MKSRPLLAALGGLVLLAATLVASPAQAASHDGHLTVRGPGSLYSGFPGAGGEVSLAVVAGGTATFSVQVVNHGSALAQFNVRVTGTDSSGGPGVHRISVLKGTLDVSRLTARDDGYYTGALAPGKAEVLTVKVQVPKGTPQQSLFTAVELRSTDGTAIGHGSLITEVPGVGNTQADIYARQGSQLYVGGSLDQIATSAAVRKGSTVTFNVKAQNDSAATKSMAVFFDREPLCGTFTVKDGSTDITAEFWRDGGTIHGYPVTLRPGASKVFAVIYKRTVAGNCGPTEYGTFHTLSGFFEAYESVRIHVPMANG